MAAKQPPPKTVPGKSPVKVQKDKNVDIAVYVEILADSTSNDASMEGAHTAFDMKGDLPSDVPGQTVFFNVPAYEYQVKGGLKIISKLTSLLQVKGTFVIQTVYGPSATADQLSAYGRGTTTEDEKAGNVTLGFHESCHREDFLRYLKTHALPAFTGKIGTSESTYQQAVQAFQTALNNFSKAMDQDSNHRTDEVGYKYSEYAKKGPRP